MNPIYPPNGMTGPVQTTPSPATSVQQVQGEPFTPFGSLAATLTIASAATIGSNLVDVRNGSMSLPQAVVNGLVKGVAVSYIVSRTTRSTTVEVLLAAGFLAGAGYLIDTKMRKYQQRCADEVV